MIGNNEIRLNQRTMQEAVQEYLDRRSTSQGRVEVTDIKFQGTEFIVSVKGSEAGEGSEDASQSEG